MKNKKFKVRVHKKPKTERIYEPAADVLDLLRIVRGHGDKILFTYFDSTHALHDITYSEFERNVKALAAGLTAEGLAGKKIAVIGHTSPEWFTVYFAVLATGGVIIPLDRELDIAQIDGFMKWVSADAIAYSEHFAEKFADMIEDHPTLKTFIPTEGDLGKTGKVLPLSSLIEEGTAEVENGYEYPEEVDREKLSEMLFTSGTTGSSKCVMLSQKNIFSVATAAVETVDFNPDDVTVSVLPIHHTYELAITLGEMIYGMHVCINDSLSHTLKNFKLFRPTALILVPLFVYTIHKRIWAEAKKKGRENLLKIGIIASGTAKAAGVDVRRRVFAEVLDAFGGRLEKIICGGAPLDPLMIEAFENFGISIYEGYGITECSPLAAVTPYYARKYGSVGRAVPCCEVRIGDGAIGESGFVEGEIQIKGDNVMLGYFDNEEANKAAFTEDGWFCTGDMGLIDKDGYIFITGRKKSVIVLENGKNVFPEEIEEYLEDIPEIAESVVVGRDAEDDKVELVALIFPNRDEFAVDADEDEIKKTIENKITAVNKKLPAFKRITKIELRDTEFEKTTSKKIKRHLVK
ncbi:MAG: AMP-binding protein [Clostridia bacterium]|nr:AMP-binding protein [Clostridia bacterium]